MQDLKKNDREWDAVLGEWKMSEAALDRQRHQYMLSHKRRGYQVAVEALPDVPEVVPVPEVKINAVPVPEVMEGNTCSITSGTDDDYAKTLPGWRDGAIGKWWGFVINNYTPKDVELMHEWAKCEWVIRLVATLEVGESGTPHIQAFIGTSKQMRFSAWKKQHGKAHWYLTTSGFAELYPLKDLSLVVENVNKKSAGKRNDLATIKHKLSNGAKWKMIWDEHFGTMVRCYKGVEKGNNILYAKKTKRTYTLENFEQKELDLSKTVLMFGPPGIGKTSFAKAHFENPLVFRHIDALGKLTEDHDGLIFDDMSFAHWPIESQIAVCEMVDETHINIKGSYATIPAEMRRIILTNKRPEEVLDIFNGAIKRRINVVEFNKFDFKYSSLYIYISILSSARRHFRLKMGIKTEASLWGPSD